MRISQGFSSAIVLNPLTAQLSRQADPSSPNGKLKRHTPGLHLPLGFPGSIPQTRSWSVS